MQSCQLALPVHLKSKSMKSWVLETMSVLVIKKRWKSPWGCLTCTKGTWPKPINNYSNTVNFQNNLSKRVICIRFPMRMRCVSRNRLHATRWQVKKWLWSHHHVDLEIGIRTILKRLLFLFAGLRETEKEVLKFTHVLWFGH